MGEDYSDEYDDEEADSYDFGNDAYNTDANSLVHAKSRNATHTAGTKDGQTVSIEDALLPCPDGFDPIKWSVMTLKEKLAFLAIDQKTWNKMYREEHLRRLNAHAEGFHFYALGEKDKKGSKITTAKV